MRDYMTLVEKYTSDNTYLLQHLRDGKFDPYTYWNEIRVWLDNNDEYLEDFSEAAGKEFTDADQIEEEEPEIFYKLPAEVRRASASWCLGENCRWRGGNPRYQTGATFCGAIFAVLVPNLVLIPRPVS
jgi:hypothetical protein